VGKSQLRTRTNATDDTTHNVNFKLNLQQQP